MTANPDAVNRIEIDCTLAYELSAPCDFVFQVEAAQHAEQTIVQEALTIEPVTPCRSHTDPRSGNRFVRLQAAAGPLKLGYRATVDRLQAICDPAAEEVPVSQIPDEVMPFLLPTRYCESDHLAQAAMELFGTLPRGHARVQAISDWVHENVEYRIGSTVATTTARDVFAQRTGVCRDFAHLAVTFCRALNIPARLVCGYARFEEPPPDFHAIFEAYIGGRWVLFDPSGMAPVDHVVRVATGPDAKDVAFATIFGPALMVEMSPQVLLAGEAAPQPVSTLAVQAPPARSTVAPEVAATV